MLAVLENTLGEPFLDITVFRRAWRAACTSYHPNPLVRRTNSPAMGTSASRRPSDVRTRSDVGNMKKLNKKVTFDFQMQRCNRGRRTHLRRSAASAKPAPGRVCSRDLASGFESSLCASSTSPYSRSRRTFVL